MPQEKQEGTLHHTVYPAGALTPTPPPPLSRSTPNILTPHPTPPGGRHVLSSVKHRWECLPGGRERIIDPRITNLLPAHLWGDMSHARSSSTPPSHPPPHRAPAASCYMREAAEPQGTPGNPREPAPSLPLGLFLTHPRPLGFPCRGSEVSL